MPIDPTSTKPGLPPTQNEPPPVHMKCRNPNCDSITAVEIKLQGQGSARLYRCTKCGATRSITVGGSVEL